MRTCVQTPQCPYNVQMWQYMPVIPVLGGRERQEDPRGSRVSQNRRKAIEEDTWWENSSLYIYTHAHTYSKPNTKFYSYNDNSEIIFHKNFHVSLCNVYILKLNPTSKRLMLNTDDLVT